MGKKVGSDSGFTILSNNKKCGIKKLQKTSCVTKYQNQNSCKKKLRSTLKILTREKLIYQMLYTPEKTPQIKFSRQNSSVEKK